MASYFYSTCCNALPYYYLFVYAQNVHVWPWETLIYVNLWHVLIIPPSLLSVTKKIFQTQFVLCLIQPWGISHLYLCVYIHLCMHICVCIHNLCIYMQICVHTRMCTYSVFILFLTILKTIGAHGFFWFQYDTTGCSLAFPISILALPSPDSEKLGSSISITLYVTHPLTSPGCHAPCSESSPFSGLPPSDHPQICDHLSTFLKKEINKPRNNFKEGKIKSKS